MRIDRVPLTDVLPLRRAVLRPTQVEAECVFEADDHPAAVHLGARDPAGGLVGIASVVPMARPGGDPGGWRIRMVGVVADQRGRGLGARLVGACREAVPDAPEVWLSARHHLEGWYRSLGFVTVGDVYDKPPVGPHVDMVAPPGR